MRQFLTLKDFFWRHKWRYLLGILWLVLVDLLQLVFPRIFGRMTDTINQGLTTLPQLIRYVGWIVVIAFSVAGLRYLWRMYIFGTSRLLEYDLRNRFFRHLETLSLNYFHHHKTGDLMAHATNDIGAVRQAMGHGVVMLIDGIVMTAATIVMMISTANLKLTLMALAPLPFLVLVVTRFGSTIHRRFKIVQEAFSDLTDRVQESFAGIRVVKSFVQEAKELEKFTAKNQHNVAMNMYLVRIWGMFFPLVEMISALSFLIVLWYGGMLVMYNDISLGDFVAFNSYLMMLTWPMMAIGWVINMMQRGAASMERLNAIFRVQPEIYDQEDVLPVPALSGKIEFHNLTFAYPGSDRPVLKNINLTIEEGKTVAIVGRTGSGKSTLVNLLLRLYQSEPGSILIDGHDINRLPLQTLRESIGYVPQDNFLFSTTIAENIRFGRDDAAPEAVEKAAKMAEVYDDIMGFPEKFATVLGERGVTLSGGQKQRVSIARALLKNPKILILDDSLSAVDTRTEEEILRNLKGFMAGRTSIIIAHRISTIKDADEIIVLEDGEITERGTHDQLLANGGLYYSLYQKQLLEQAIEQAV